MRKKMKELLHKEEGFTLVELLAVIVILGIIVAIAIPAIGNVIDTAGSGATAAEEQLVFDAARLYEVNTSSELSETAGEGKEVQELIDEGYLELRGEDNVSDKSVRRATETEREANDVTYVLE